MSYTKLFNSIVTSTIWAEDDRTRIVWITILACADRNGEIQASIPGLARLAGVPTEDCRKAILKFLSPDPDSRTKDDEGRRIETIEGGWLVINHGKYREMASDEDRRKKAAERQQRARDRKSRNSHATVTPESRQIPQAEAEAEAEEVQKEKVQKEKGFSFSSSPSSKNGKLETCLNIPIPAGLKGGGFEETWKSWVEYRIEEGKVKNFPMMFTRQLNMLASYGRDGALKTIEKSLTNAWRGLFPQNGTAPSKPKTWENIPDFDPSL